MTSPTKPPVASSVLSLEGKSVVNGPLSSGCREQWPGKWFNLDIFGQLKMWWLARLWGRPRFI